MNSLKKLPKPRSAWLLLGDEASYGPSWNQWTCSPLVEKGDVLFIYFMKPHQRNPPYRVNGIHFVARALERPFVDSKSRVNTERDVSKYQWWVNPSPFIAIQPISYVEMCACMGEKINLRGRSGKYLSPGVANKILSIAKPIHSRSKLLTKETLSNVAGRSDLPNPKRVNLGEWREIPSGLLRVEKEVERYIVEPLLRFCKIDRRGLQIRLQHRIGKRIADFVVLADDEPKCVIEVKQRIIFSVGGNAKSTASPHYIQLRAYARELKCPSLLIDCDQIFLFSTNDLCLLNRFERRNLRTSDLAVIAKHLGVVASS